MLEVSSPDYSQLARYLPEGRGLLPPCGQELRARAGSVCSTTPLPSAICSRRNPTATRPQADLNAAEQGMKILGIKNPEDLAKAPRPPRKFRCLRRSAEKLWSGSSRPGRCCRPDTTQAFTISDMSTVWVLANVYQADLAYVRDR